MERRTSPRFQVLAVVGLMAGAALLEVAAPWIALARVGRPPAPEPEWRIPLPDSPRMDERTHLQGLGPGVMRRAVR